MLFPAPLGYETKGRPCFWEPLSVSAFLQDGLFILYRSAPSFMLP
jgi:hypothetical protein